MCSIHKKVSKMVADSFFFFKQKTAYEMVSCDWSSDVCSSDLEGLGKSGGVQVIEAAVPILVGGAPAGAVVVTEDVNSVRGAVRHAVTGLIALGGVVLIVG